MKFKTNMVIGAIFLALLAFVYFYEIKGGEERKKEAEKAKELVSFQQSEARRVVIERGDTTLVLENKEGEWVLSAPVVDLADQQAVERYLRNLQETERERVVVDSADAVGAEVATRYGLDEPRLKVLLETESGNLDPLAFGEETPTEQYTYVQQQGPNREIFVVRAWRFDNLNKGVFDLRDRRVLPFDKEEVVEFRLRHPDQQFVAVKEGDEWRLKAPVDGLADKQAVDGLLNRLTNAKIEAFVAEQADEAALSGYGLAPLGSLEVSLLVGDDRAEKRLRLGGEIEGGRYYARDLSTPQVFLVDSTLVNALRKEPGDLRDKKPFRFPRDEVNRIEFQKGTELLFAAEKDTSGTWSIVAPQVREARSWKLNSMLTDLEQLEVAGFVEAGDPGYQSVKGQSLLECTLRGLEQELLQVRFVGQRDSQIYLTVEGDPSVYRVEGEDFADLNLSLDDVAEASPRPGVQEADTTAGGD